MLFFKNLLKINKLTFILKLFTIRFLTLFKSLLIPIHLKNSFTQQTTSYYDELTLRLFSLQRN